MTILWVLILMLIIPISISEKKKVKENMNPLEYLQIYNIVLKQLERTFRDSSLPPNMIDTMAHTKAIIEAEKMHKEKKLVAYYERVKAGAV